MVQHVKELMLYRLVHAILSPKKKNLIRLKNDIYLFSILVVQLHQIHPLLNLQKVNQVTKILKWFLIILLINNTCWSFLRARNAWSDLIKLIKCIKINNKKKIFFYCLIYSSCNSGRRICWFVLWSARLPPIKHINRSVNSYWSSINRLAKSK